MGYLKSEAEIRPKGNFFVVDTEYVGHNGSDLKSIISAIQTAESSASTAISGLDTRITANTTSISGLDTRVTALEESGGGGGGGTTNYNELSNIPQINGVNLKGNLSAANLGLANAVDIPTVPTNVSAFNNDSGYLTEEQYTGTVTSVSVKMNGSPKGTVTSSGTIDLGTVITAHQSLDACAKTADLGNAAYETVRDANSATHTGWVNHDTDAQYVPTMAFMAFWNGAYNSSGSSNLTRCQKGAFGDMATKSSTDYLPVMYAKQCALNLFTWDKYISKKGTVTVNTDGSCTFKSAGTWQSSKFTVSGLIPGQTYKVIYDVSAYSTNSFFHAITKSDNTEYYRLTSMTVGQLTKEFTATEPSATVTLSINNSATSSSTNTITLKISVSLISANASEWTEYAPTNAELYKMIKELKGG